MNMQDEIVIGDKVEVRFNSSDMFEGRVLYMPQATGDCWHILEVDYKGREIIHYVQTYEQIIRYHE